MDIRQNKSGTDNERNTPAWMHLQHPIKGHYIYHGEPEHVNPDGSLADGVEEDNPNIQKSEIQVYFGNSDIAVRYRDEKKRDNFLKKNSPSGVSRKIQADQQTESFLAREKRSYAAMLIKDFRGFVDSENDGKPLSPTPENKALLLEWHEHIPQMIINFSEDEANFFDYGKEDT